MAYFASVLAEACALVCNALNFAATVANPESKFAREMYYGEIPPNDEHFHETCFLHGEENNKSRPKEQE